jgi:cell division protein FtsW
MATVELPTTEQPARKKMFGLPIDTMLLVVAGALVAFGLMMVYSTTFDWSYREFGNPSVIFLRQLRWLAVGVVAMLVAARMPYHWWRRLAVLGMAGTLVALVGVLVIGTTTFNAQRSFFNGSVQPSELAKLVVILYLAVWLDSKSDRIHQMSYGLLPFAFIVGVVAGLILLQPDLSAAGTVVIVAALMFFIAGADILQMGLVGAAVAATAFLVLQVSETGRQRLADYLAGVQDLTQASWHVQQAAIAFINGGLFGRGLGESHQKFGFLPTPHTDSIFAIVGEELGLVGCLFLIALFLAFAWRGFRIAAHSRDQLGAIMAAGLVCWVVVEALINIAVMVGAMPFAGNALPFISYGGSSLVVTLTGVGILLSISRRDENEVILRKTRGNPNAAALRAGPRASPRVGLRSGSGAAHHATFGFGRRDRRGRVSRPVGRSDTSSE